MKNQATILLSGGIDSAACAHFLKCKFALDALFIDYGQPSLTHEKSASHQIAAALDIALQTVAIKLPFQISAGEVPARNGLFAMIALACSPRSRIIAMGLHGGTPYYDCSPAFAERIDAIVQEYSSGRTRFFAPFLNWTKTEVLAYCKKENIDLSSTYSCEAGTLPPCGRCLSCQDRAQFDAGEGT